MTQLVMPRLYDGIARHQPDFIAWRWAFFVPGALHIIMALLVIFFAQVQIHSAPATPLSTPPLSALHQPDLPYTTSTAEGALRIKTWCFLVTKLTEK